MSKVFIGIDPGVNGGMAAIAPNSEAYDYELEFVYLKSLSTLSHVGIWNWLREKFHLYGEPYCCIEKVTGYVKGSKAVTSRIFQLGRSYGTLIAYLELLQSEVNNRFQYEEVAAVTWEKEVGASRKGLTYEQRKKWLKEYAKELYPSYSSQITKATCDALLLAHLCKRRKGS